MTEQTPLELSSHDGDIRSTVDSLVTEAIQARMITDRLSKWQRVIHLDDPAKELELRGKLAAKIVACYTAIEAVGQTGFNSEHQYSFASAEAIYRMTRAGLAKAGIIVLPMMGDYEEQPIYKEQNRSDSPKIRRGGYVVCDFEFCLIDAETGYTIVMPWRGEVMEYGDKAMNKVATNATKYFLRTIFLMPTDEAEDSDAQGHDEREVAPRGGRRGSRPANNRQQAPAPKAQAQAPDPVEADPAPAQITDEDRARMNQEMGKAILADTGLTKETFQMIQAEAKARGEGPMGVIVLAAADMEADGEALTAVGLISRLEKHFNISPGDWQAVIPDPAPAQITDEDRARMNQEMGKAILADTGLTKETFQMIQAEAKARGEGPMGVIVLAAADMEADGEALTAVGLISRLEKHFNISPGDWQAVIPDPAPDIPVPPDEPSTATDAPATRKEAANQASVKAQRADPMKTLQKDYDRQPISQRNQVDARLAGITSLTGAEVTLDYVMRRVADAGGQPVFADLIAELDRLEAEADKAS